MTPEQLEIVSDLTRHNVFKVLVIKKGFVFLTSPVIDPEVMYRVSPKGKLENVAL